MLIYTARLWLECNLETLLDEIAYWLGRKLKLANFDHNNIFEKDIRVGRDKVTKLFLETCDEDYPQLYSFKLSHPDKDEAISGRQWVTEIGVKQPLGYPYIEVTIMLYTSEISLKVNVPESAEMTRPLIVNTILENCSPAKRTPGIKINEVDEDNVEMLWELIQKSEREAPIIIVSPLREGGYIIDPNEIIFQVGGLADVIQIRETANTYKIEDALTRAYSAYDGAINIIYPAFKKYGQTIIRNRRFLAAELAEFHAKTKGQGERELLSILSHRINRYNHERHISPEVVRTERLHRSLEQRKAEKTTIDELEEYYEEYLAEFDTRLDLLKEEKEELEEENLDLEIKIQDLRQEINEHKAHILSLQNAISAKNNNARISSPDFRDSFMRLHKGEMKLHDTLVLLEHLYPERLIILPSAYASAKEAAVFRHSRHAFDLLHRLVTEYWEILQKVGYGDTYARKVFGDKYHANESELASRNERARRERSFMYKNEEIFMEKHLAYGVEDSIQETWRAHFHWDAESNKIVLGHCGKHLYLPNH